MITKTRQTWAVGQEVKVGFFTLTVRGQFATPGDYLPDAYILANKAGTQLYKFVPHNGLTKITLIEAEMYLDQARQEANRLAYRVMKKASDDAQALVAIERVLPRRTS